MTDELVLKLSGPGSYALARSAVTRAPEGYVVEVRPPHRTNPMNDRFHAMLRDVLKSGYQIDGQTFDLDDWKTAFISTWMIETGKGSRIARGINGEMLQLYWRSSKMSNEQLGEVMILIEKFCAERGIQLREAA